MMESSERWCEADRWIGVWFLSEWPGRDEMTGSEADRFAFSGGQEWRALAGERSNDGVEPSDASCLARVETDTKDEPSGAIGIDVVAANAEQFEVAGATCSPCCRSDFG